MAVRNNSFEQRNAYIPPSVQKSISNYADRSMPAHLKKYQQGGYVPSHAEKAITQHMQKSLPGHLKKYADPYVQQNIIYSGSGSKVSSSSSKPQSAYRPSASSATTSTFGKDLFASESKPIESQYQADSQQSDQEYNGTNNYDFIMNSQNQNKPPLFAPENTKIRIAIFVTGIILLIILMMVFFSFLNSAGNKQKENLLSAVQTQQEITRVIDLSRENISDDKLKDKVLTLRAVMISSQQDVIAALGARGQEANPKDLAKATNPQTDAELEAALAQARYDQALNEILLALVNQYASQLQAVYNSGSPSEKELATEAFNQVDLIYALSQQADAEKAGQETSTQ